MGGPRCTAMPRTTPIKQISISKVIWVNIKCSFQIMTFSWEKKKVLIWKNSRVKICRSISEGQTKDREAGAGGEGDPQTSAFTSEGNKPQALRIRVGIEFCTTFENTARPSFLFCLLSVPQIGLCVCRRGKTKAICLWRNCLHATCPPSTEVQILVSRGREVVLKGFYWSQWLQCIPESKSIP